MSYRHLSMDERNVIYRMRFQGYPDAEIARCLGCHRSTIGRECKRNGGPDGRYFGTLPSPPRRGPTAAAGPTCGGPRPAIPT
jgi:IS30 family transposase